MGPDSKNEMSALYIKSQDSDWLKIDALQNVEIGELLDADTIDTAYRLSYGDIYSFSVNAKFSKEWEMMLGLKKKVTNRYHMSRKKFKKWLMGTGISRNNAQILCESIIWGKGRVSYHDIWLSHGKWDRMDFFHVWYEIYKRLELEGETA